MVQKFISRTLIFFQVVRKTTALRRRISEVLEGAESKRRRRRRRRSVEKVMRSSSRSEEVTRWKRSVAAEDQFDSECLRSQNSISNLGSQGDTEVSATETSLLMFSNCLTR